MKYHYTPPRNLPVDSTDLLKDISEVAKALNVKRLSASEYSEYGKYNVSTISRRFGTWNRALSKVGLKGGNINEYTDEELFENILNIWQHKGKQPVRRDLSMKPSKISQSPYARRFKSWSEAVRLFVDYANQTDISSIHPSLSDNKGRQTSRDPSTRLRFRVLTRDRFSCVVCGASPAEDPRVKLHVDHRIPWSKGGETTMDNLQTLCSKCNIGKSNLAE